VRQTDFDDQLLRKGIGYANSNYIEASSKHEVHTITLIIIKPHFETRLRREWLVKYRILKLNSSIDEALAKSI
jgi:hypothetical protein